MKRLLLVGAALALVATTNVQAGPREDIVALLMAEASAEDAAFAGFSGERGQILFSSNFNTGKPETPSCTSCHSTSPQNMGETRAGKPIEPIAVSKTPERFTDPEKVEKWFRRNCRSVIGRECTALEKGDFITYMMSQ
ncbi:MAG TPA: DUF1924 domain-containing protein [Devosia sp.]|nr:DUF1924 domain-containing protein [Devosia sp.]